MRRLSNENIGATEPLPIKLIQFGGGNFLRGFVDWMIEVLNINVDFNCGVAVVKPTERGDYDALRHQDGFYHVILRGMAQGSYLETTTRIHCIEDVVHPYRDWEAFLHLAETETLKYVVSNTTESGIRYDPTDRTEDKASGTFPAMLTLWLYHRYLHFNGDPKYTCTFLPLELISDNGTALKSCILFYAKTWGLAGDFAAWIDNSIFCNTLVDRIVSGFPTDEIAEIQEKMGYQDDLVVVGERYHSWIIEGGEEVEAEIPFKEAGLNVQFVDDLDLHRQIKVRFLNGAHTSLVPIGLLSGYDTVKEAIRDHDIRNFIRAELIDEILPTIDHDKTALEQYIDDVITRFNNPSLQHRLVDISLNSISKFGVRLKPSLLDYYRLFNKVPKRIAFALAALIRYYKGQWQGESYELRDSAEGIEILKRAWIEYEHDPLELVRYLLGHELLWGHDLLKVNGLDDIVTFYLNEINHEIAWGKLNFV